MPPADDFGPRRRSFPVMSRRCQSAILVCDLRRLARADVETLDVLARLQLAARRRGLELQLRGATPELAELVVLAGLDGVLRLEAEREAERSEERLGVEEERELGDPPV